MFIDLRSDTVTQPTQGMLQAMMNARVGDDVFEEDPTVLELEAKVASLFSKEAGLFCPSGTMANQVAIKILTQPQQELICDSNSHIYYYEAGGIAFNSGLSVRLIKGNRGRIQPQDIEENINPPNIHQPETTLVSLENTSNRGGGSYYSLESIKEISKVCRNNNLKLHLDGARIFNALAVTGDSTQETGEFFDTISVCLSKGLGAPVGSVLLSSKELIKKARKVRKAFGGGMRQAGYLAAAGIYALDNHLDRLHEDHEKAHTLWNELHKLSLVEELMPAETNIVVFRLHSAITTEDFVQKMKENGILVVPFGKQTIRMVTHLDITNDMINKVVIKLRALLG